MLSLSHTHKHAYTHINTCQGTEEQRKNLLPQTRTLVLSHVKHWKALEILPTLTWVCAKKSVDSVDSGGDISRLPVSVPYCSLRQSHRFNRRHFSLAFFSDWDGEQQDSSVAATRLLWKWWKIHPARFCFISCSLQSLIKSAVKASTSILKVPESRRSFAVIRALILPGI